MSVCDEDYLPFFKPDIGCEEINEVVDTLNSDWITTGPKVKQFEKEFASLIGAEAALAIDSATNAMLVALAALKIGKGDEVITTPMTFCSTLHVVEHRGANIRLVDVSQDTLNIDADQIEHSINDKTRAIIPVHLYGHPCDLELIYRLANKYNLEVLEDAAHALIAKYHGNIIGSNGNLTAFSFYATKNITTGEGGMLTGDTDLIEKCRPWSLHGLSRDAYGRYNSTGTWKYDVILPGYKCNMTDISASLGIQQINRIESLQKRRIEIVTKYNEGLNNVDEVCTPENRENVESAWHLYVIKLKLEKLKIDRDTFILELKKMGIGASVHFIPNHIQPYFRDKYNFKPYDYPVAYSEFERIISLPLYTKMSNLDVERVINAIKKIVVSNHK